MCMKISDIEKKYGKCSSRIAALEGQKAKLDEQKKQIEEQISVLKNEMVQVAPKGKNRIHLYTGRTVAIICLKKGPGIIPAQ